MSTLMTLEEMHALEKLREEELDEARSIQEMMMPQGPLSAEAVAVSHKFQPISAVGGDFLDYFELMDGTVGLYIGDVCGKGLPAALYAALAVGTLRGFHKTGKTPDILLSLLNRRLLLRGAAHRHCALQYALFDPRTRQLQISSAGMPTPLFVPLRGDSRFVDVGGVPPGLFSYARYDTSSIQLEPGDSMLFFTDGLPDAVNLRNEEFGLKRLRHFGEEHRGLPAAEFLERIFSSVISFASGRDQYDDMAAALLRFLPKLNKV